MIVTSQCRRKLSLPESLLLSLRVWMELKIETPIYKMEESESHTV